MLGKKWVKGNIYLQQVEMQISVTIKEKGMEAI